MDKEDIIIYDPSGSSDELENAADDDIGAYEDVILDDSPKKSDYEDIEKPFYINYEYKQYEILENDDFNILEKDEIKCPACEEIFTDITLLKEHCTEEHCPYKCSECAKGFSSEKRLKQHLRCAHLESMNLKCSICGKISKNKYCLQQHLLTHSKIRRFKCNVANCGKTFRLISSFRQHENTHTLKNRKECPVCHKFVTKLSQHIVKHSEIPPFACNQCNRTYTTEGALDQHVRKHIGTILICNQCSAKFTNKHGLQKHKKTVHGSTFFKCPYCKNNFNRKDNLLVHIRTVHNTIAHTKHDLRRSGDFVKIAELKSKRNLK